jgi:hypothetical protein
MLWLAELHGMHGRHPVNDANYLQTAEGVGEQRARGVREGLSRLAESSILERHV